MTMLTFSDVLKKAGIDPTKTKLLRHAMIDKHFRACFDANMVREYTAHQRQDFSRGYDYWAVFISDKGNYARLYALYRVGEPVPDTIDKIPSGYPMPETFSGEGACYALTPVDALKEYEGRMIIDWGKSARMWHQRGTTEKTIVAIQAMNKQPFPGYEKVVLSFEQLQQIVENNTDYELWQTALSSINAVYLIVDRKSGKQYVGSAYGQEGLLGRWRSYVESFHGNNKRIRDLISAEPKQYQYFQFSILQLLEKTVTNDEVIRVESLWKRKLLTIPFGMNDN